MALMFDATFLLLILTSAMAKSLPPNIVFLLADDLGWNDVGFRGSQQVKTPVIDALAKEGLILNNYYTLSMCTPSRASLMTGRYAMRTGLQHKVIVGGQRLGLPLEFKLMPEFLNDLGYESHAMGKWHLGSFHKSYLPTSRGFTSFYGAYNGKGDYFDHWDTEVGMAGLDWHLDDGRNSTDAHFDYGVYGTRALALRAEKIILEHDFKSKPLFLYVPFLAPHSALGHDPIQVPRDTEGQVTGTWHAQRRKYLGMLKELDDAVGKIMEALKTFGGEEVMKNTMVMFSSDNGGAPNGMNLNWGSNYPLRSTKGYYYEGGSRAVALVWGEMFKKRTGQVSTEMMHITDWLPTLFEAAVGDKDAVEQTLKKFDLDGFSMFDVLTGKNKTSPRTEFVFGFDPLENAKAMRVGRYKYILNPDNRFNGEYDGWYQAPGERPGVNETMIEGHSPSQILCGEVPEGVDLSCYSQKTKLRECLYDIERDPCEYYNLVDDKKYQNEKDNLLNRIKHWEKLQRPAMRPPIDSEFNPKQFGHVWKPWTDDPTIPENEEYLCNPKHCGEYEGSHLRKQEL